MFIDNQPGASQPLVKQTETVVHESKGHDSIVCVPPATINTPNLPNQQQNHKQNNIEQQQQQLQKRQQQQHHVSFKLLQ